MAHGDAALDSNRVAMLRLRTPDVAALARRYSRLGLRVLRERRDQALVELPCGIRLVLTALRE